MTTSTRIDNSAPAVLVTGGAGYIGSHACKALRAAGFLPVVFDNLVYGHRWAVQWGPLEQGDLLDPARLDEVFRRHEPIAVMHFAALTFVGESVTDPARYWRNNVAGTLNLLDAMRAQGVRHFVFSSTCATYGLPERLPIAEDTPQRPINPYGATKLTVERMLADYDAAYGIRSVALRYFNAAGADALAEIGEAHEPETHLIPLLLDAAAGLRPGVTVFGTDYATVDGTCVRDYIHVTDLASAHVHALQALQAGEGSQALNLGVGQGHTVRQMIAAVERITGLAVPVTIGARRAGDPDALVADARLARARLGWEPNCSSLDEIVRTAWRWHQGPRMALERAARRGG